MLELNKLNHLFSNSRSLELFLRILESTSRTSYSKPSGFLFQNLKSNKIYNELTLTKYKSTEMVGVGIEFEVILSSIDMSYYYEIREIWFKPFYISFKLPEENPKVPHVLEIYQYTLILSNLTVQEWSVINSIIQPYSVNEVIRSETKFL